MKIDTDPPSRSTKSRSFLPKLSKKTSSPERQSVRYSASEMYQLAVREKQTTKSDWTDSRVYAALRPLAQRYLMSVPAQLFIVFISFISCIIYVASSYLKGETAFVAFESLSLGAARGDGVLQAMVVVDFSTTVIFVADFALNCLGCDSVVKYIFSPLGFADMLSGLPLSAITMRLVGDGRNHYSGLVRILKLLKIARVSRLSRLVRLRRASTGKGISSGNEEVKAEVLNACVILFMLVFATVDVILILEVCVCVEGRSGGGRGGTIRAEDEAEYGGIAWAVHCLHKVGGRNKIVHSRELD